MDTSAQHKDSKTLRLEEIPSFESSFESLSLRVFVVIGEDRILHSLVVSRWLESAQHGDEVAADFVAFVLGLMIDILDHTRAGVVGGHNTEPMIREFPVYRLIE